MARTADHAERRRQVAAAVLRVAAADGLDAASLARVAAEAGTSIGLIQRYFRTKDAMLAFAAEHLAELTGQRVDAVIAGPGTVREKLHAGLATLLPFDAERAAEGRVWLAFLARAVFVPELAHLHRLGVREIEDGIADAIRLARATGQAPVPRCAAENAADTTADPYDPAADRDAGRLARLLTVAVDGIAMHALVNPDAWPAEALDAALAESLDRIFAKE